MSAGDERAGAITVAVRWLASQQFQNVMQVVTWVSLMGVLWYGSQMFKQMAIDLDERHSSQIKMITETKSDEMRRFIELCCGRRVEFDSRGNAILGQK